MNTVPQYILPQSSMHCPLEGEARVEETAFQRYSPRIGNRIDEFKMRDVMRCEGDGSIENGPHDPSFPQAVLDQESGRVTW